MATFHKLRVKEVRPETSDCVSVAFDVPEELADQFDFIQGQYLTIKTKIEGEEVRRSYSICTAPQDKDLRVAIKKVPGGAFSTYANDILEAGSELDVLEPAGRFYTQLDPSHEKHYVGFAAGSGITPVMSILKTILQAEPKSQFTLFYGNKGSDSIIFLEELEALKNKYLGRLSIHHVLSREQTGSDLFYGRIDGEKAATFFQKILSPEMVDDIFLCGPEPMILGVRDRLEAAGVTAEQIHFELFTSSLALQEQARKKREERAAAQEAFDAHITIQLDGNILEFPMRSDDDSILDAALKTGADLPFACKGGVCCTCRAKVDAGEVDMLINYALEPDEVEAGYVLTCQSIPKTKEVTINYDA
jgi:ring-1,2-phenylacetyl-CoA epoxidase subunit PaaE